MTKKELKEVMDLARGRNISVVPARYSYFGHKLIIDGLEYLEKDKALKAISSAERR